MATREATCIYQFITNNQASFDLCWRKFAQPSRSLKLLRTWFLVQNFSLIWQFWISVPKFWSKKTNKIHHQVIHIRINVGCKYQLQQTVLIFWKKFPKKYISSKKQKNWHYHWILHILTSLSTKFQLKLIIFLFRPNLTKEGFSNTKEIK